MAFCGDGNIDPGEKCDLGNGNVDRPALQLAQGNLVFAVAPYELPQSAVSFYNYFSASGHTGFEQLDGSSMFFYRNTSNGILSLIQVHGIDFDTSGLTQPSAHVIMDFTVPAQVQLALIDDQGEFAVTSMTQGTADWAFQSNSDGLVLAGFPFPGNWTATVDPQLFQGIATWRWIDSDGSPAPLALDAPVTLTAFNTPSMCRSNCTVPVCGDGILDGGEVCDDGNTVGGDGCSANCKSLQ